MTTMMIEAVSDVGVIIITHDLENPGHKISAIINAILSLTLTLTLALKP